MEYSNILRMVDNSNINVTLHEVKAHAGVEGNCWADEFVKIGSQGKIRLDKLELPRGSMNLAERFLLMEIESFEPGNSLKWVRKLQKGAVNNIRLYKNCSEVFSKEGSKPAWSMPRTTMPERYTLEGLIDK